MQQPLFESIPLTMRRRRVPEAIERKRNGQFKAIQRAGSEWQQDMLDALRKFLARKAGTVAGKPEFTFEEFRVYAEIEGYEPPNSLNAWGALPQGACRAGLCKWTGRVSAGLRAESHGRLLKVWVAL